MKKAKSIMAEMTFNIFDYPCAAFGGDGNNGKALWVCFDNVFSDPTTSTGDRTEMYATFIPVFGKGKYGTVTQQIIPALNFPPVGLTAPTEIAVTPAGKVYISGAPRLNGNAIMTVNPTGPVNLGPDSFSAKRDIAFSNLESFGTVVPYMPNRNSL